MLAFDLRQDSRAAAAVCESSLQDDQTDCYECHKLDRAKSFLKRRYVLQEKSYLAVNIAISC